MTNDPPAPDEILNVIRCKCQNSTKNQCGTNICSCRKNDLLCVSACGDCHRVSCYNKNDASKLLEQEDDKEENIDDDDGIVFEKFF